MNEMTETQALEDRITQALALIRCDWPLLMPTCPPGGSVAARKGPASLITRSDDDKRGDDLDANTRRVDASREVVQCLNSWTRMVVQENSLTATVPDGFDASDMARFLQRWARWLSEHDAGPDAVDELEDHVQVIRLFVPPVMSHADYREPIVRRLIGRCTEQREHEDGTIRACGGRVYAYPDGDGVDEHDRDDPWATCQRCGSRAVVSVWQRWMFPEVEDEQAYTKAAQRIVSEVEVMTLAHREFGKPMTRRALKHWVTRGLLEPIDPTAEPLTFRLGHVVDALSVKAG